jgi:hypothetical protein
MQLKYAIFVGAMAALASLAVPALARNSDAENTGEQPTSSSCSARQKTADGTWQQVPCQELGATKQTSRKSATRGTDEQTR